MICGFGIWGEVWKPRCEFSLVTFVCIRCWELFSAKYFSACIPLIVKIVRFLECGSATQILFRCDSLSTSVQPNHG